MRTVTIEKNIYDYDELNDDAKQTAKNWYLENCRLPEYFSEDVMHDLEVLFGKNHLDVEYSLSYSQGDGLNIYGMIEPNAIFDCLENHNGGTMFEKYENVLTDSEKQTILAYVEYCGMVKLPKNPSRYSYCVAHMTDVAKAWQTELEFDGVEEKYIGVDTLKKFEQLVIGMFTDLCMYYEKRGYDYFYDISDEEMSETCEANGWCFTEDGGNPFEGL